MLLSVKNKVEIKILQELAWCAVKPACLGWGPITPGGIKKTKCASILQV